MSISFTSMWQDKKFKLLFLGLVLVAVFEVLSLTGVELPHLIAFPLFLAIIFVIGHKTILAGFKALLKLNFRSISLLMLIAVVGAFVLGEYEEGAIVIVLFTLGEYLESVGIQSSRSALKSLVEKVPKTAKVIGTEQPIPIEQLKVGDVVTVQPGDLIPVDGEVQKGKSSVDESTITGEPIPKDKHEGDSVYAGTLNVHGFMEIRVTKAARESTLSKIVELTYNAGKTKAETQKFIERFSRIYTPAIIVMVFLLVGVPTIFFDQPFEKWFREGLTLLVIACPCALVISTPVSIYSAIGNASQKGAIIKGGRFIEDIGRIKAIALDKTRTITEGRPVVSDIVPFGSTTREHLLACAAGIEKYSEHPLAASILDAATAEGIEPHQVEHFQSVFGKGATAECLVCYDRAHAIGKLKFITEHADVQEVVANTVDSLQQSGKTAMVISAGRTVEGVIAVTDAIKQESKEAILQLRALGVEPVMLTGDNSAPAKLVANEVGIEQVHADLLPEGKVTEMQGLLNKNAQVAMVGDGVNDAPALALATVGIAMGSAGSDAAIETADIAILNDRLSVIPFLVALGRRTLQTIRINTAMAVGVKLLFIGLATAGLGNLALAIFADVGVTLIVILLSLRLMKFEYTQTN